MKPYKQPNSCQKVQCNHAVTKTNDNLIVSAKIGRPLFANMKKTRAEILLSEREIGLMNLYRQCQILAKISILLWTKTGEN